MMTASGTVEARPGRAKGSGQAKAGSGKARDRRRSSLDAEPVIGAHLVSDGARAAQIAEIMKALAHPLRIQIVAVLCLEGELHVNALAERLGQKQAIVSQQLRILRMRGLLAATREGGLAMYRVAEPRLREMVRCMEGCSI